ncbi:glycosyltransferase family protein [Desulfosudis oleivorans]|uniref:Glycosyltransferase RgtA/B/C/D-like domain-containing protein n=1 Tax=Desulfosudis oleivorans (strain DSM 6200 / JCM 39069 / Hxd3) TaxID=96561 RepID=A8ZY90_DESOH|nr:hypothetical protein [Desulfosudis oleivorans]ABW67097.1 hypothetical protein Dole_1291 [Desulfosudis oleivorans Hxd3]
MRLFKHPFFLLGMVYFLILMSIALWVRDIPNQPDAWHITLQQIANGETPGNTSSGDRASFAAAAIDVAEHGRIRPEKEWVFNLWPPGFIFLEALIMKIFGPGTPVILILQILAAVLFSIVLALLYDNLKIHMRRPVLAAVLPLLMFTFPMVRMFLLQPAGITLGESFSIGFFLVCMLLAIRSARQRSLRDAVCAGICLALSAYFRSQFEFILLVLTAWGVLLVIVIRIARFSTIEPGFLKATAKTIGVMLLVAHITMVPWRIYRWTHFYEGNPRWVMTTDLYYGNSVMRSEDLREIGGGWLVAGGGNLVCRIDPSACGDTKNAKKLFFRIFFRHPIQWYSLKFSAIGEYWFSSPRNFGGVKIEPARMDLAANGLLLMTVVAGGVLLFTRRVRCHGPWIFLSWFTISLFSAYGVIFSLAPLEVRYFYFPKIVGLLFFLMLLSLHFSQKRTLYQ